MKRNIFLFLIGVFLFPAQICHAEVKTIDVCDPSKFGTLCRVAHNLGSGEGLIVIPSKSTSLWGHWEEWIDQSCPTEGHLKDFTIYRKMHCEDKDKICEHYKLLFKPPANNCIFEIEKGVSCVDGEYNVIEYKFRIRDSQRRVSDWFTSQRSAENADVECEYKLIDVKNCNSEKGECFEPLDTGGCTYIKSDGTYDLKESCLKKVGKGGSSGGGSSDGGSSDGGSSDGGSSGGGSSGGGSSGGGSSGGGSSGGGSSGGGSSGGGSSGGGSGGGGSGGGGSSGGGSSGGGSSGGGSSGGGSSGGGSSGGGGSGSGKDYSDNLKDISKKLDDIEKRINFGNKSEIDAAVNEGGFGDSDGEYSIDRGATEHRKQLDGLVSKGPANKIKSHKYIVLSNAYCSVDVVLFNRSFKLSLCEFEKELALFGRILLNLAGLSGLLLILRR